MTDDEQKLDVERAHCTHQLMTPYCFINIGCLGALASHLSCPQKNRPHNGTCVLQPESVSAWLTVFCGWQALAGLDLLLLALHVLDIDIHLVEGDLDAVLAK